MKPHKTSGVGSFNSRERGANSEIRRAMLERDEMVLAAVSDAFASRREFDVSAAAKVVADQAELTPPAEQPVVEESHADSQEVSQQTERERMTAEALRLVEEARVDEVQDEHDVFDELDEAA